MPHYQIDIAAQFNDLNEVAGIYAPTVAEACNIAIRECAQQLIDGMIERKHSYQITDYDVVTATLYDNDDRQTIVHQEKSVITAYADMPACKGGDYTHDWGDITERNDKLQKERVDQCQTCGLIKRYWDQNAITGEHGDYSSLVAEIENYETQAVECWPWNQYNGRADMRGNIDIFWNTGEIATTLPAPTTYPIGSQLSCAHEHPEGITLSRQDAETLGIEVE